MNGGNASLILSIIATSIAVASFCGALWRVWRDRPRLIFYVDRVNFHNRPDNRKFSMVRIRACNVGFRPIILTRFVALGNKSAFSMGVNDEPAAMYGIEDQKFPSTLEPGEMLTFHPMTVDALEKNAIDPKDPKMFFDPYRYFVLIDSFGRYHHMNVKDIRWNLRMDKERRPLDFPRKFLESIQRKIFFARAKQRFLRN